MTDLDRMTLISQFPWLHRHFGLVKFRRLLIRDHRSSQAEQEFPCPGEDPVVFVDLFEVKAADLEQMFAEVQRLASRHVPYGAAKRWHFILQDGHHRAAVEAMPDGSPRPHDTLPFTELAYMATLVGNCGEPPRQKLMLISLKR